MPYVATTTHKTSILDGNYSNFRSRFRIHPVLLCQKRWHNHFSQGFSELNPCSRCEYRKGRFLLGCYGSIFLYSLYFSILRLEQRRHLVLLSSA